MVRVLHVTAYYAPAFVYGGPPRTIHGLCRALRQSGVDVRVFTTDANGDGELDSSVTAPGEYDSVPVSYFPRTWPREPIGSRQLRGALRAALRSVDLVHIHGLWNRVVWAAAAEARRAGVPYVLSPRGMLQGAALAHRSWRKRVAFAAIERHTVDHAALLHATSDAERQALTTLRPAARVALIPNGIDVRNAQTVASGAALGLPADARLTMFVGRLHRIKRLDLLLDAFAILKTRVSGAHLVIAGPDEQSLRPVLESRHPSLAPDITWTGAVDPTRRDALLAHADALVLCSDSESFGMSVLEGMAAGCPVVVTDTCGWDQVAQHRAGFVVRQDAEAMAAALTTLSIDAGLRQEMGSRGRELASTTYGWPAVAQAFVAAYGDVVAHSSIGVAG